DAAHRRWQTRFVGSLGHRQPVVSDWVRRQLRIVRPRATDRTRRDQFGPHAAGRAALPAMAGHARQGAHGERLEGRSTRAMPPGYIRPRLFAPTHLEDHPDTRT